MKLNLLDLSKITAVAHNGSATMFVLVKTAEGLELKLVAAPLQAMQGLQMLAEVANGEASKELPEQALQLGSEEQPIPNEMIPVTSSNLASIGYIPARQLLLVKFLSGSYYEYQDVARETFRAFLAAPSKGQFLNKEIKPNYNYYSISQKRVEILFSLSSLLGEKVVTCDPSKLAQVEESLANLLTAVN